MIEIDGNEIRQLEINNLPILQRFFVRLRPCCFGYIALLCALRNKAEDG